MMSHHLFMVGIILILMIVIGGGLTLVAEYFNRGLSYVLKQADNFVRMRLLQRESLPVEDFINNLNIEDELDLPPSFIPRQVRVLG